jgi:flagellar secretion chaperone FliS
MSTYAANYSPGAYRANSVLTASHGQQIVMLYDGARRFLHQASVAMAENQPVLVSHVKLTRAEDIIRHLRDTLNMDQGELPERLLSIYTFSLTHLRQARLDQDPEKVHEVSDLLGRLRESWATVAEYE